MQRNANSLADGQFDVVVVGGGAFGAAAVRNAALRGLRAALIERADFGSGASAECFKMVHGGIRYLQHLDLPRARASARERSAFLRTAPHLVKPLPIAIPTYGYGRQGKLLLGAGMLAYDVICCDRNRRIRDVSRRIRGGRFLSRARTLELFPHLNAKGLTGAAVFEDGQMHHPARLVMAIVESAVSAGAVACNYLEAKRLLFRKDEVCGIEVEDRIGGGTFAIHARGVLNAAGPWAEYLLADQARFPAQQRGHFSRDAYCIIDRTPGSPFALAVQGSSRDRDAVLSRAARHLFLVPWRGKTLVGVWHRLFPNHPDEARIEPEELAQWLAEINAVNPELALSPDEVTFAHCGLVPFGEHADPRTLQFGKESRFIDHRRTHGVGGLVTLIGIRYTMARADAERALQMLLNQWATRPPPVNTEALPLAGGDIADMETFRRSAQAARPAVLSEASLNGILCHHGSNYGRLLARIAAEPQLAATAPGTHVTAAEIRHAVEHEMAVRLSDVVLRRTDLSGDAHPGAAALRFAAQQMAALLGWSAARMNAEIAEVESILTVHHARKPATRGDSRVATVGSMLATFGV